MKSSFKLFVTAAGLLLPALLLSQDEVPTSVTTQNRTGDLPISSSIGTSIEHVDLATGSLSVNIPLWSDSARHSTDVVGLRWNSNMYYRAKRVNYLGQEYYIWTIVKNAGWQLNQPSWLSSSLIVTCYNPQNLHPAPQTVFTNAYIFTDSSGTQYRMPLQTTNNQNCGSPSTMSNPDVGAAGTFATGGLYSSGLLRADGAQLSSSHTFVDSNGNYSDHGGVNWKSNGTGTGTDNLGRTLYSMTNVAQTTGNLFPIQTTFTVHDSNGNPQTVTITWETISLTGWVTESWYSIQSITLPNGQSYQFQYDPYGEIKEIDLPDGAVITYTWSQVGTGDLFQARRAIASRTETVNGVSNTWTINATQYSNSNAADNIQTVVTYPAVASGTGTIQNQSIFNSTLGALTDVQIYAGTATGTPMREYSIAYALDGFNFYDQCDTSTETPDQRQFVRPTRIITVLDDGTATKKEFTYESPVAYTYYPNHCDTQSANSVPSTGYASRGNVATVTEYGWGTPVGSIGAYTDVNASLVRTTTNTYLHNQSGKGAYLTANIVDKIGSQTIQDASSNTVAVTNYNYDTTAIGNTSGTPAANHDYTNYSSTNTVRGNVTSVQKWLKSNNSYLTTTYTYDDLGNILQVQDPKGYSRSFSYTDSFADSACLPTGGVGDAYVTQYTDPLGHLTKLKYYSCSGLKQQHQDQNDINNSRTGTTFTYDLMNRPLTTSFPDGGSTQLGYTDAANAVSVSTTKALDSGRSVVSTSFIDGLGRAWRLQLQESASSVINTDTTYDGVGHVASVTNPYRSGDTLYQIEYQYDALGRKVLEVPQDGTVTGTNNVQTAYVGASTTVTDQTGRTHKTVTDSLGRLSQVFENPSQGTFNGVAYPKLETDYSYDVLGNLFCVQQKGTAASGTACPTSPSATNPFSTLSSNNYRGRWFVYDSLSRLTDAYNPETGHTSWTYDANSNVATKTDNKSHTITYSYDNENRVTGKTYSAGDHAVTYSYSQTSYNGLTVANGIDRRTGMSDASGTTAWSFDAVGRAAAERRTIGTVTKTNTTLYDLLGLPTSLTYPNNTVIAYSYDTAGRVLTVTDSSRGGLSYVGASSYTSSCPVPTASGVRYTAFGSPTLYEVGYDPNNPTTAGVNVALCWTERLQQSSIIAKPVNTTLPLALRLSYNWARGSTDNGDLVAIANNLNTNYSKNFYYDAFNRISEYKTPNSTLFDVKYTIDAWGNLTNKTPQSGYGGELLNAGSANNANQLSGYGYDLNGNMSSGDGNTYAYDSENRITTVAGVTYTYDGDGERVKKSSGKLYWGGGPGHALVETDASGNPTTEYVYFAGKIAARRDLPGGTLRYYFDDHLGTSTAVTDTQGNIETTYDYAPYGELHYQSGTDANVYKFTGKERDAETGNDYFGARYFQSAMGRYITPDWSATAVPVAYAVLALPQTLNLYAYVGNNPTTGLDPDGHMLDAFVGLNMLADFVTASNESDNGATTEAPADSASQNQQQAQNENAQAKSQPQNVSSDAQSQNTPDPSQSQPSGQSPSAPSTAQNNTSPKPGRTPAQGGAPNSTVVIPDGKGGSTTRTYGPDGRAVVDIDRGHDHNGAGDPHAHDWDWSKTPPRQPARPLKQQQQVRDETALGVGATIIFMLYWAASALN